MLVEVYPEFALDLGFQNYAMTEYAVDYRAPQLILFRHERPAHGGPAARFYCPIIARQVAPVLRVSVFEPADGTHPHAVQVASLLGRVALEVPVQCPLILCSA